ncbi:cupin domain-containing protein [Stakelama tenebrarum]|uniref:Cupin domain-containing protein n=1 Tax=Stakelama tenebrarum TaxID=2711215 RepID=A0A6G6Y7Q3_9SPHN|nr:cupin domain-containing protein [Sphingosinithalassobacter tenebrarum]QIG80827.1 cupin domain-containing protein [Sphingosinithalassobacter tenebrarum]
MAESARKPRFEIRRGTDASDFEESGLMQSNPLTETEMAGAGATMEAGVMDGTNVKLLFDMPGMSLARAWFKSGFPLPRHTHNTDCLYYVLAGSLRMGTEELVAGDTFFVGADVPYSYVPGPDGVEVLEFRASNAFDIKLMANNKAFWDKATEMVRDKQAAWAEETPPSGG